MAKKKAPAKKGVKKLKLTKAEAKNVVELMVASDQKLKKLRDDIDKEVERRRTDKLAEFHQSEEYKKLKAKRVVLAEKGDKLHKEVTVNVPIKFTVTLADDGGYDQLANLAEYGLELSVDGKLDKKQSKFNKAQACLLSYHIDRFIDGACNEIEVLLPKEVKEEFEALEKEYKAFLDEVKKAGIKLEDLEY